MADQPDNPPADANAPAPQDEAEGAPADSGAGGAAPVPPVNDPPSETSDSSSNETDAKSESGDATASNNSSASPADVIEEPRTTSTGRRIKHVASREISPVEAVPADHPESSEIEDSIPAATEVKEENVLSTTLTPSDSAASVVVVDPTLYAIRQRKRLHHLAYRVAQACSLLAFIGGVAALILCLEPPEFIWGELIALSAVLLAGAGLYISGLNPLAYRVRGYAAAALVFACISLGINLLTRSLMESEDKQPINMKKSSRSAIEYHLGAADERIGICERKEEIYPAVTWSPSQRISGAMSGEM
jgi:hypothetical protein